MSTPYEAILSKFSRKRVREPEPEEEAPEPETETDEKEEEPAPRRGTNRAVLFLIIAVLVTGCIAVIVLPKMLSSDVPELVGVDKVLGVKEGAWRTVLVVPVSFIGESTTTSSQDSSSWSSKCYIYDVGLNVRVASQVTLVIGAEYQVKGQIRKWTDGSTWIVEEARR